MLHENNSTLFNRICIRLFFIMLNIYIYFKQFCRNNRYIQYLIHRIRESFHPPEPEPSGLDTNEIYIHKDENNMYRILVQKDVVEHIPIEQSNVRFMTVQYFHPKMSEPLSVEIPSEMLLVGNELFSKDFIQWYLKDPPNDDDDTYHLEIIDNDLNMGKILPSQYILLDKSSWILKDAR